MKTQINTLVHGSNTVAGTSSEIRMAIAKKVVEENPETMTISINDVTIELKAEYSVSRKTVNYIGVIPVSLYHHFFGDFGIPKENASASICINSDMTVWFRTNSKKNLYQKVAEINVTIL